MVQPFVSRLSVYEALAARRGDILADAERVGDALGMPARLKGRVGTTGANSAFPGLLRRDILREIERQSAQVAPLREIGDDIRNIVKSVYGDDYDAAPTNSCEAALGVVYDALLTPPQIGRGETYRARCLGLLERHSEHHLSYGRPFPPRYKDVFADRGASAGELGILGRRNLNTDVVMIPMEGAEYPLHGIKFHPVPLLAKTNPAATIQSMRRRAAIHAAELCGVLSLGYDTVGYGYGDHEGGAPVLQRGLGALAAEYGVPYVSDNAWGTPFIGTDLRATGADVMLYSMDKVAGAPTSGLIIGRESAMVPVRRALGIHGDRFGSTSAHGKGAHVSADPGKMAMVGVLAALRAIRDRPDAIKRPIDLTYEVVVSEHARVKDELGEGITITKSYNMGGVEINYERTWSNGAIGIPIFNNEDRVAGSHFLNLCMAKMGVLVGLADDGNIVITPGLGTTDADGTLDEEAMSFALRALFAGMILLRSHARKVAQ